MDGCPMNPYPLPTMEFVGGETQEIAFDTHYCIGDRPFGLSGCKAQFAIVSYTNRTGEPILVRDMEVQSSEPDGVKNVLYLKLLPEETLELAGKYIYQISIRDVDGDVEIPRQGVIYIYNNINKAFGGAESAPFFYR